jgi:hypothetical protein
LAYAWRCGCGSSGLCSQEQFGDNSMIRLRKLAKAGIAGSAFLWRNGILPGWKR